MINNFRTGLPIVTMPSTGSFVVIPSDTSFPDGAMIRQITINGPGTVTWKDEKGVLQVTNTLPAGTYTMMATAIMLATTATGITGWY